MRRHLAIRAALCIALAACSGEQTSRMVIRSVHTDLLESEEHYEVSRVAAGGRVRRMILTPALHALVDGGDLPSLVMPPSAEVRIPVPGLCKSKTRPMLYHSGRGVVLAAVSVLSGKQLGLDPTRSDSGSR